MLAKTSLLTLAVTLLAAALMHMAGAAQKAGPVSGESLSQSYRGQSDNVEYQKDNAAWRRWLDVAEAGTIGVRVRGQSNDSDP